MARWARERDYDGIVANAAGSFGVPASLIKAVIAAESGFKPDAVRVESDPKSDWPAGVTSDASRGLMQLLCWRARELGYQGSCDGLFEPHVNIMLGTRLLSLNYARTGAWPNAISAYNGGVRPELGFGARMPNGKFRNESYVDRVMTYWDYFEAGEMPAEAGAGKLGLLALVVGAGLAIPFFGGVAELASAGNLQLGHGLIIGGQVGTFAVVVRVLWFVRGVYDTVRSNESRIERVERWIDSR